MNDIGSKDKYWEHANIVWLLKKKDSQVEFHLIVKYAPFLKKFIELIAKPDFNYTEDNLIEQAIEETIKEIRMPDFSGRDYEMLLFDKATTVVAAYGGLKDFSTSGQRERFFAAAYMGAQVLNSLDTDSTSVATTDKGLNGSVDTALIMAAQELQIKRFQEEVESLGTMVEQLRVFIRKMVHEASSHIRFIFFNLNKLDELNYTPDKEAEYGSLLHSLKEYVQRHNILLQNLMDFSRTDYGIKIQVTMERVQLDVYINEILAEYRSFIAEIGFPLQIEWIDGPVKAIVDKTRFRQVVHNLLLNATRHGEKGAITVVIDSDPIANTWSLAISNSFAPYTQTESYQVGQLGIGLPLCKELIELMNGKMEPMKVGSIYTVTISMPLPITTENILSK